MISKQSFVTQTAMTLSTFLYTLIHAQAEKASARICAQEACRFCQPFFNCEAK